MSANFSTHAANFTSALRTGVDPRTGQFFIRMPLFDSTANRLLGPHISLSANYSTLSSANLFGLGSGVTLQGVSVYTPGASSILLSSGEFWYVDSGGNIPHRKLKDCEFKSQGDDWIIRWKSGESEVLIPVGDGHFVTRTLISPLGKRLHFDWVSDGASLLLQSIRDEVTPDAVLCHFNWPGDGVNITAWPGRREEYSLRIDLQNGYLASITRHMPGNDAPLQWRLENDLIGDALIPTRLHHPTGMRDEIAWQADALPCPGGGALSAVQLHARYYGQGQPETVRTYDYDSSGNNFLGNNADVETFGPWSQGRDYISNWLTEEYTYSSTERVTGKDATATFTRTYNNYHFLIAEETQQDDSVSRKDVVYHSKENADIGDQPCFYAFPHQHTSTLNGRVPETTRTTFDDYGNPLTAEHPDGTRETWSWYQAKGEADQCPPEPNGFVRFIGQKITTPPMINGHAVSSHIVTYTYETLGETSFVVQKCCTEYSEEHGKRICLNRKETHYVTEKTSPEFGRITKIIHTQYDPADGNTDYPVTQTFSTEVDVDGDVMTQTVESETHDKLKTKHIREQSIQSGRIQKDTDTHGIVTLRCWDSLGRILSETRAAGTEHSLTQHWQYTIETAADKTTRPVTIQWDELGRQTRTLFDGAGRAVRQDVYDIDQADADKKKTKMPPANSPYWRTVSECQYDALGRVISKAYFDWTTLDRRPDNNKPSVTRATTYRYEKRGARSVVHHADGVESHSHYDPVASTLSVWQQNTGINAVRTGTVVTECDTRTHHPVKRTRYRTDGRIDGVNLYEWDGLGRLRRETDAQGHTTEWTYDIYGRVLTQTLPDESTVCRRYAPHLTGDHPISLCVTPEASAPWNPVQAFDGLGRLTSATTGGRTTHYYYTSGQAAPVPELIVLPSHRDISNICIPGLGFALKAVNAGGIHQTFEYDPKTGQLLKATEGHMADENHRAPSGTLTGQTFTRHGRPRSVIYTRTLEGLPESYTDITGQQTRYARDTLGRLTSITDDILTVSQTYDPLGRLLSRTVNGTAGNNSLTTTLGYDEFSREITRTLSDNTGTRLELRHMWLNNGLLAGRATRKGGHEVLKETYGYDRRNRLVSYMASSDRPEYLPPDAYGQAMTQQTYHYDALNNLTTVTTTLHDGITDTTTHHYENPADPTQLTKITHTDSRRQPVLLRYDHDGRLFQVDGGEAGHRGVLSYDPLGRLLTTGGARYGYDAHNRLVSQYTGHNTIRELYYRGNTLVNEVNAALRLEKRLIHVGGTCVGVAEDNNMTLLATDHHGSPVWSLRSGQPTGKQHVWSPWGQSKDSDNKMLPGFNGERIDLVSAVYHLGNGYRAYSPVLMRFHCPDSLSPFGPGGINPYTYCSGDPVNHIDPSGHISGQSIAGIVMGAIGLGLAIWTGGSSIVAAESLAAAIDATSATAVVAGTAAVAADATGIASGALEESDPKASAALGWVSMALGLASMGIGLALTATRFLREHANPVAEFAGVGNQIEQTAGTARRTKFYNGIKREYVSAHATQPDGYGLLGGGRGISEKMGGWGEPDDPGLIILLRQGVERELSWARTTRRMNAYSLASYRDELRDFENDMRNIPFAERNHNNRAFTDLERNIEESQRKVRQSEEVVEGNDREIARIEAELRRLGG
ncbi:RHS repeat-associated core domain-containing protein [Burkholderia sp. RS02]|uniref:RHS repeat-associated core domain-containing protein n=1 Tax=unclassified Burkholderia TaxID=2613784 RepID=UPI00321844A8